MHKNNNGSMAYEPSKEEASSLALFHEGQSAALESDIDAALAKFEQSLVEAKKASDPEWIAYIEGTLAYLREDRTTLTARIPHAGANAQILSKLDRGLETRGYAHYKKDYGG